MKYNKILIGSLVVLLMAVVFCVGYSQSSQPNLGGLTGQARDIIGSRTGTSTDPVEFYGNYTGSTTYPVFIGGQVDEAVLAFQATNASTSGSSIHFSILASNDTGCDTSTSSPDYGNPILVRDINWFDASQFIKGSSGITSLSNSTSTIYWNIVGAKTGRTVTLTNLNVQCLAVEVNAAKTELWAQLKTKSH